MIRTMINGFCMALADSVPGVSGGTIALILGFYDKFIGSINQVFYGKKEEKKEGLIYLIKLLLGWAVGMILAVLVLTKFFETNIYAVSSLFLGFIFVVRNCVQGIGRSRFVLGAGAAELVARIAVCLTLPAAVAGGVVSAQANPLAFYALCAADPMAWIAADIVLAIPFFRNILRRDYRYMNI